MMLFFRGWGLMAALVLILPTGLFLAYRDDDRAFAAISGGATLLFGGIACWVCGRRWDPCRTDHTMYNIALEYWGMFYVALGGIALVSRLAGQTGISPG